MIKKYNPIDIRKSEIEKVKYELKLLRELKDKKDKSPIEIEMVKILEKKLK